MDVIKCRLGCEKIFKTNETIYRHEKNYCEITKKKLKDHKNIYEENLKLKEENLKLKEELIRLNKEYIESLKLINNTTTNANEKLIEMNTETTISSMSAIKVLTKQILNVPILKEKKNEIVKSLEDIKTNGLSIAECIIKKYKNGTFVNWIGEIISKAYKGDTLELQSIWSTDTSRLKYIVGELSKDDKKAKWVTDDGGLKVKQLVIVPILEKIKEIVTNHIFVKPDINKLDKFELIDFYELNANGSRLIADIDYDKLSTNISKIIAQHLNFKRFSSDFNGKIKLLKDTKSTTIESSESSDESSISE